MGSNKQKKKNKKGQQKVQQKYELPHFKNRPSLQPYEKNSNYYIQTDEQFRKNIKKVAEANTNINFLDAIQHIIINKTQLTDQKCDLIDYNARLHAKANRINPNSGKPFEDLNQQNKCLCGCERGKGKNLSLLTSVEQLNVLGSGIILFLVFNKYSSFVLYTAVAIFGIYSLKTNFG